MMPSNISLVHFIIHQKLVRVFAKKKPIWDVRWHARKTHTGLSRTQKQANSFFFFLILEHNSSKICQKGVILRSFLPSNEETFVYDLQ